MSSFNRVTLMGNLTKDPELVYTTDGTAVAKFGLAMNRQLKDGEEVTFVDVTVWDKQAEVVTQFLKKGRLILIEGRLRQEKWTAPDSSNRSKLIVVAERVQFLPGGPGSNGNSSGVKVGDIETGSPAASANEPILDRGYEVPF